MNMPTDCYDCVQDAMAALLERLTAAIDWPRLLREASFRHSSVHPDRELTDREWNLATGVCGQCLAEALLADDVGAQTWVRHPATPREHQHIDWPAVVAHNLPHRAAAHWHPFQNEPNRRTP
ncbi:hypothetical protein ABZ379_45420 [Streptomyces canus]|uniref:hypothetical protein n=1 Tax=Streptomyces canus TaxID=58343 RepID=UPI0033D822A2